MAVSKNLKIRDCDIDENLLRVIYGYKNSLQKEFVDLINESLNRLEDTKQDKADMSHYFNKDTEKLEKYNLSNEYNNELDAKLNALVGYEKLDNALKDKIARYENNANEALSNTIAMQSDLEGLKAYRRSVDNEINDIWMQITGINDRIAFLQNGGTNNEPIGSTQYDQITLILDNLTNLRNRVDKLSDDLNDLSTTKIDRDRFSDDLNAFLDEVERNAKDKATPELIIPGAYPGMVACLGGKEDDKEGKLKAGYILLKGKIARNDTTVNEYINKNADWIFDINKDRILVRKEQIHEADPDNPDDINKNLFYKECISEDYGSSYFLIKDAFTKSWIGNNKFIYDQFTGELIYISDGIVTKIHDPEEIASVRADINTINEDLTSMKSYNSDVETMKSDITTINTKLAEINDTLTNLSERMATAEDRILKIVNRLTELTTNSGEGDH